MKNDYKDYIVSQTKYPGISRCMKDIYESLNMDYIDYAGIKDKDESSEIEYQR